MILVKQKVPAKKGRLKRYRQRVKHFRQSTRLKKNKKKNERKFGQEVRGDDTKTYQKPDARETKNSGVKYGNQEKYSMKDRKQKYT